MGKRFDMVEPMRHEMRDGAFYGRPVEDAPLQWADTVLNSSFRITPETRILPEPAPAVGEGDMGVRHDGTPGTPSQAAMQSSLASLEGLGLLSTAEVTRIKAQLHRASGRTTSKVMGAGIATTANDAKQALAEIATHTARGEAFQQMNRDFWDKRAS